MDCMNKNEGKELEFIQVVKIKLVEDSRIYRSNKIKHPSDVGDVIYKFLNGVDREHLGVICLNTKNKILNISIVHIGTLNSADMHPREIFKTAILSNSASIIMFHNHPSGDTTPSKEDINASMRIKEGGKILGIELLDSIIVGEIPEDGYYSLKAENYL